MKKGKLFLATAFIPVMTGAALYFSSNTASAATPGWYDPMPWGSNGMQKGLLVWTSYTKKW